MKRKKSNKSVGRTQGDSRLWKQLYKKRRSYRRIRDEQSGVFFLQEIDNVADLVGPQNTPWCMWNPNLASV